MIPVTGPSKGGRPGPRNHYHTLLEEGVTLKNTPKKETTIEHENATKKAKQAKADLINVRTDIVDTPAYTAWKSWQKKNNLS